MSVGIVWRRGQVEKELKNDSDGDVNGRQMGGRRRGGAAMDTGR